MSDKSFGDHMNRNVVKNSLLSTAVTGLSLEDLTHNAVLLPVSLSQEVISRPDQTIVAQSRTLAHSDHAITNIPSGDANANLLPPNLPPYSSLHTFDAQQNVTPPKLVERPRSTLSKASVKSEDDFDVNEYFARLQGTRYVSAPINSGLKEDGNANLEATEENLEEINLNEEKEESVQQSLTADIAQNFSQLPTVLPQVASAVFSSFSNMLQTRKSREQTPEDAKPSGYQEVQFERPSEMANVVKEIAPPPREPFKEPPTVPPSYGTTSYRLPTKKKYAQIPGLTSRDNAQIPVQSYQMPPMSQNAPSYFVPGFDAQSTLAKAVENQPATSYYVPQEPSTEIGNNSPSYFIPQDTQKIEMIQDSQSIVPTSIGPQDIVQTIKRDESRYNAPSYFMPQDTQKIEIKELTESNKTSIGLQENVKVTQNEESNKNAHIPPKPQPDANLNQSTQISNTFAAQNIPIDNTVSQNQAVLSFDQKSTIVPPPQFFRQESAHAASVLPPPPMFSNTPQRDSQPGVGKSILPPSVARRIGAKQQVMKTPQISPFTENIFTPVPIGDDNVNHAQTTIPSQSLGISNQSAFASFNPQGSSPAFTPSSTINLTQSVPASIFTPSALQTSISPSSILPPTDNLPSKENFVPPPKSLPPLDKPPTRMIPPILAASYSQPFTSETSKIGEIKQSVPPSIFVPSFPTTSELTSQSSIPPPTMFSHPTQSPIDICPSVLTPPNSLPGHSSQSNVQPIAATISPDANAAADIPSVPMFTPSLSSVPVPPIPSAMQPAETTNFPPTAENTPKPMTEPPKATSNVSYRLTKKRPQYYAGPIEGVGSISNNIKPVIPELQTGSFQGALFTPQQDTTQHLFSPQIENVAQNAAAMDPIPFDISRPSKASYAPYEVIQPQQYPNPPQIDYNTTFDMSRPTTDNYSEPKDSKETGAFGLFGSLKSKLTSLDINKIQSSVTTFFDPAYNDTKKDTSNVQEYATYEQQQYTYPQYGQQASSIDIFVPNVEQSTPAYDQSYKYQTPDANQYNMVQDQQHYPSQDAYNYYKNPEQNTGYYTNPMQTYQAPSAIIPPTQPYYPPSFSSHGQDNLSAKTQSHENQQQNVKAKSSYSLVPPFMQVSSPKEQETSNVDTVAKMDEAHTAVPTNTPSSKDLNVFKPAADLPQTESKNSLQFDDNATSLLDNAQRKSSQVQLHEKEPLKYDTQLKTDESINNFFNNPLTNVPHLQLQSQQGVNVECSEKEQQSKAEAIPPAEAEVPPTMFFDNRDSSISNLHKQNTKMSYMVKSKQEPVGTANVNLPDVMKQTAQQSKTELLENIDSNFTDKVKENESIDPAAAVNFFEHIPSNNLRWSNFEGNDTSVFTPHSREDEAQPSEMKDSEIQNIMFKLQTNPADFFGLFSQAEPTATGSFYTNVTSNFGDKISDTFAQNNTATALVEEPKLDMSSALLFDLSSILANKSIEINDLRDNIEKLSIQKEDNGDGIFNPNSDPILIEKIESLDEDDVSDLNICETCREVKKPESREEIDDVTNQMIENITSPIQLSNPVEVPLTECNTVTEDRTDFENNQCAEISHITEETIETIQVQSATELLEDEQFNTENRTYGWATDEASLSAKEGQNYSLPDFPGDSNQKDFGLAIDPNTIGFFGNTLFEKVSNTDFTAKDTTVLLRQMSIPTAPPEEDDTKSETIDVHSIEQDAKQDFPLFEEFVIEPSGKDDNDDDTAQLDSFTSRVDKFQKKEEPDAVDKSSPVFELPETSPSLPIASYFDTGNYAAETHYRNSLTSPTNASYGSPNMRVPPGFEDQYQKLLYGDFTIDKEMFKQMPDTTTQTRPTYSPTYSSACNEPNATTNVTASSPLADISSKSEEIKVVQFTSDIIGSKTDDTQNVSNTITTDEKDFEVTSNSQAKLADSSVVEPKIEEAKPVTNIIDTTKPILTQNPLPDPINFFSSSAHNNPTGDDSVNRLASYFSSPDKTDHSKSFFELSQGQNHYRLETKSEQTPVNIHNIPHEQYLANLNLMRDLTSVQNIDIKPETNVRTVNYFTIEYDNDNLLKDFNKGEPNNKKNLEEKIEKPEVFGSMPSEVDPELIENDETLLDVARKCEHCCNLSIGPVKSLLHVNHDILTEYKVRKCMDSNSEDRRASVSDSEKDMDHRGSISVNFDNLTRVDEEAGQGVTTGIENRSTTEYSPVKHHWFYRIDVEGKSTWRGFSVVDSKALEDAFLDPALDENTLVATDGGRFDVNVKGRLRFAVYWTDKPSNVRRCSWFYKGTTDARYVPYTEAVAEKLEDEYRHGMTTGEWHRRLSLPNNELVVMHGPAVMVHFLQGGNTEAFGSTPLFAFGKRVYRNPPKIRVSRDQPTKIDHLVLLVHGAGEYRHQKEKIQSTMRPRVVRRGVDESEIEEVDPTSIDHLLLLCHGVGSACDMRFRAVEEVVDDFRATSLQLIQSHYKNSFDSGLVGRVEVLPISWHATLHSGETGVDRRLARITLDSIPRLRNFTNDTVLDVLFYTSPVFCQTIINTVCAEMNRIYKLFSARNPSFSGGVSLGGHSLGSVILYDLLCHQQPQHKPASRHASPPPPVSRPASPPPPASQSASPPPPASRPASPPAPKQYVLGAAGTGQPSVQYPALDFHPVALYALGSPIAIFECIRGVESLGADFALPTCKNFFNIFHPYDPIAYRIEPLVNPQLRDVKPSLIPHHKGRKRMHLELKDTMARVGADIKAKLIESIKSTWSNMWKTQQPPPDEQLEKVVEDEFEKEPLADENKEELKIDETTPDMLGRLNAGRRVDYVLQEAPFEMINEYLFAMSSHVCYWESEDTMLMMLREIYDSLGVSPDCTLPQQTLTVQRTRPPRPGESVTLVNTSECPSTSRTNNL